MTSTSSIISVNNLFREYHVQKRKGLFRKENVITKALNNINLEIKRGEIFGLVGINGAGKTSLIKILATLLYPTKGEVRINGLDIRNDANKVRFLINMSAGAERMLHYRLSARENLKYYANLYNIPQSDLDSKVDTLLKLVGMEKNADIPVERYSKGMKQRVQIARSLINDPKILLLDEPTLGLDVHIAKDIRRIVKEKVEKENMTVVLTSHYLHEIEELVDRLAIIHEGRIVAIGTPEAIKSQFNFTKILSFKVKTDCLDKILQNFTTLGIETLSSIPVVDEDKNLFQIRIKLLRDIEINSILHKIMEEGELINFKTENPTLEETFLKILDQEAEKNEN